MVQKAVGRPRSNDPKVHLPSLTIYRSSIETMAKIQSQHPQMSLSEHYQKAIDNYILIYSRSITRLGFSKE